MLSRSSHHRRSRAVVVAALLLLAVCCALVNALSSEFTQRSTRNGYFGHRVQPMQQRQQRQRANDGDRLHRAVRTSSAAVDHIEERFFPQFIDHFNSGGAEQSGFSFLHRFWSNDAFVTDWSTAPVFVYLRGESPSRQSDVTDNMFDHLLAEQHHAYLLSLEHRYYGKSQPFGDWTTESLRFLNTKQALEDVVTFIGYISAQYNLTSANPWIVFGGSYSGALAAWFRVKHPDLVIAAVASSACVRTPLDDHFYFDLVAQALADHTVGGSEQCAAVTKAAFAAADKLLDTEEGRLQASTMFKTCFNNTSDLDAQQLGTILSFLVGMPVQYSNYPYERRTVTTLCAHMTSAKFAQPLDALVALNQADLDNAGQPCVDSLYEHYKDYLMSTQADASSFDRQYYYARCVEYNSWMTCEAPHCIVSRWVDLSSWLVLCHDVFGFPADNQFYAQHTVDLDQLYGADHPVGSNIVWVNGDHDPHSMSSVLHDLPVNQTAVIIRGGSHCDDTAGIDGEGQPNIAEAHKKIKALVSGFINDYRARNV